MDDSIHNYRVRFHEMGCVIEFMAGGIQDVCHKRTTADRLIKMTPVEGSRRILDFPLLLVTYNSVERLCGPIDAVVPTLSDVELSDLIDKARDAGLTDHEILKLRGLA